MLLVAAKEVPAPLPARIGLASRVQSALVLVLIVVAAGVSVALLLGAAVVVISSMLEDAVR